jgi:putative membrane-bound dehydrogenase-like protein
MKATIRRWLVIAVWLTTAIAVAADEPREPVIEKPLPPEEAAMTMQVPDGFRVTLFAAEPDVQQPIGFCIDDRGRLWVAEAYNYPKHGTTPGDRINILEDTNGDGHHDKRTVFHDQLNYVTGIEVGFGGAWVMSPPFFYFIPDADGDDRPDAEPQVLLDGFGNHANPHNLANGLAWGPDGWLYGTHGRTNWSKIGKPGTPDHQRIVFDGGVFRFHPTRRVWEPYADGTTNPWGIDWNDVGDAFVCNCVTPHLYHVIQGAHFEPWRNRDSSRYAYQRIPAISDHVHYAGQGHVRESLFSPEEDAAGGGHAHCGSLIYLGHTWPQSYRNTFLTCNIHGKRINNDLPRRSGSGYVASHGPDLLRSQDPWFTGVTLRTGPDGSVFVSDWSDTGECHHYTNTQRQTGRIYRISYGDAPAESVNVAELCDADLVRLHQHPNDWFVRHARRNLQERQSHGDDLSATVQTLMEHYESEETAPRKLRAFWTLLAMGQLTEDFLVQQLDDPSENIRVWAVKALSEQTSVSDNTQQILSDVARDETSACVRLALASLMQRVSGELRWNLASALLQHEEDTDDANLPLMYWYGIEPLIDDDIVRFVSLALRTRIPLVTQFAARRAASHSKRAEALTLLVQGLATQETRQQFALMTGLRDGLEGQRFVAMPVEWRSTGPALWVNDDPEVRDLAMQLSLMFDDPEAIRRLQKTAVDPTADLTARSRAIASLSSMVIPDFDDTLISLLEDKTVRVPVLQALGKYEHPQTADRLLQNWKDFTVEERLAAAQTLAARVSWSGSLLDAVEGGQIPVADVSAYTARQIDGLGDSELQTQLVRVWGELRPTPEVKARQIRRLKSLLTPETLERADTGAGRALFQKSCSNCHRLFGTGGTIGPDITGSQRTNLDYLLQTLMDPGAEVARDFQLESIQTLDGRVISGIVVEESDVALTLQSVNERFVVAHEMIEDRAVSKASMMPDGLLQSLTNDQIRQLFAYLMSPRQVELPESFESEPLAR